MRDGCAAGILWCAAGDRMIVADVSSPVIVEAFGEGDLTFELSRGDKYVCVVVGVGHRRGDR